ncbi:MULTISPECIES: LysR family transcriptional regulator [unclassified Pseudomonas]|uniref:LysR family transcriptional regulator n=1 Tax=unclassified Pseudomonas TaxID=196821 RepID=UPI000C86B60B|nr:MULTISPECIES: LysR family transcriptional regulator [unclassified Pseudomonas]PMV24427.1 LysR family transcriptional regulator [Pseudomonas sp. FW305-3-2-15-C-TSA2]PMV30140.1 LysR family transcriptional regulator [Pseudomonas sp. DP16D-L5]PMV40436.1 LysR family transcriptional regulator [Pseudomonas sp. FW305-3-2-15-A-LB2]PMV47184.1 LysR family transcriptional regulator [Pseudomonas sp. FW305-3-2-15-C-R2A1]PMV52658.1 LysR family transcriptional regulator [Pseudomonas sp. FW305-3-2-15-C-LB1]
MLRELKTFIAVTRHGTFAAAGMHIGLTQSAVSAQIRQLEQALGVQLFDRTGRQATLNAAGLRALPLAREILETFNRMAVPVDANEYRGELKVGAITTAQTGLLPQALVRLRQAAPTVECKLIPGVSLELLSRVDAGELDSAIIIRPPFDLPKELHVQVLRKEPFALIVPHTLAGDNPLQLLATQPHVRYDRTSFGGRLVSRFLKEHKLDVQVALELDELEAIVKMVECGLGVSLIPQAGLWLERSPNVRIIPLGSRTFYREIILLSRYSQRQLPVPQLFTRCLLASANL